MLKISIFFPSYIGQLALRGAVTTSQQGERGGECVPWWRERERGKREEERRERKSEKERERRDGGPRCPRICDSREALPPLAVNSLPKNRSSAKCNLIVQFFLQGRVNPKGPQRPRVPEHRGVREFYATPLSLCVWLLDQHTEAFPLSHATRDWLVRNIIIVKISTTVYCFFSKISLYIFFTLDVKSNWNVFFFSSKKLQRDCGGTWLIILLGAVLWCVCESVEFDGVCTRVLWAFLLADTFFSCIFGDDPVLLFTLWFCSFVYDSFKKGFFFFVKLLTTIGYRYYKY